MVASGTAENGSSVAPFLLGHNSDPNSRTAQAACDHTIRHSGSKESVIPRRYWCGELGANGRPEKRRPPRPGSSPDWRPHNRFGVPNYGCRRLLAVDRCAARADTASSARSSGSPTCIHPWLQMLAQFLGVLGGEVDLVADSVQPELHSFVGWLAVEIVDQGDEDLLDHLHHFPHTDTRSEHASTDDHTLSHRNASISCKGYANRPGLERADSIATAKV